MIGRYFTDRFALKLFGPIALALAFAAGGGRLTLRQLAIDFVFLFLALAHFRLWDDLADRASDAITHPNRVLVRASSLRPFIAVCVALGAAALAMALARGVVAAASLAALQIGLAAWYALRGRRSLAGTCVVLTKYPVLVLAAASDRISLSPAPIAAAAIAAYVAACAYEAWHDPAAFSLGGQ